jgi:hypothetical protein
MHELNFGQGMQDKRLIRTSIVYSGRSWSAMPKLLVTDSALNNKVMIEYSGHHSGMEVLHLFLLSATLALVWSWGGILRQ